MKKEIIAPDCACVSLIVSPSIEKTIKTSLFSERLYSLIGEGSVAKFARKCGIGDSVLRKYLNGAEPGINRALQIWRATGCSLSWLIAGEGEMYDHAQLPKGTQS